MATAHRYPGHAHPSCDAAEQGLYCKCRPGQRYAETRPLCLQLGVRRHWPRPGPARPQRLLWQRIPTASRDITSAPCRNNSRITSTFPSEATTSRADSPLPFLRLTSAAAVSSTFVAKKDTPSRQPRLVENSHLCEVHLHLSVSSSKDTISSWPGPAAMLTGAQPSLLLQLGAAPLVRRKLLICSEPPRTARCIGLIPSVST